MILELKLRKVGDALGVVLPEEALARLQSGEGDTLVFSDSPDGGFRVTPNKEDFAQQMTTAKGIAGRYRNALNELAK